MQISAARVCLGTLRLMGSPVKSHKVVQKDQLPIEVKAI